jgi:hypothetical protein
MTEVYRPLHRILASADPFSPELWYRIFLSKKSRFAGEKARECTSPRTGPPD